MRHSVMGPRELFYADIFASRRTGCRSTLGMPGVRDRHSGCVGAYMVEHDLFDFLLLSLPDNDWHSHRAGPEGQVRSIALADVQLARVMEAAGGLEPFLEEHAMIVMADHSQAAVTASIALADELARLDVLAPGTRGERGGGRGERSTSSGEQGGSGIAVCPSQRAAMVYVLDSERPERLRSDVVRAALGIDGVELAMWLERDAHGAPVEAVIARPGIGEMRFCPGGDDLDLDGRAWSLEGSLAVLDAKRRDGRLICPDHPDALDRVWSALTCPTSGDVLLSAAPGREFSDLGGQAHVGGGSHGSLRGEDSLGALILCGVEIPQAPRQWTHSRRRSARLGAILVVKICAQAGRLGTPVPSHDGLCAHAGYRHRGMGARHDPGTRGAAARRELDRPLLAARGPGHLNQRARPKIHPKQKPPSPSPAKNSASAKSSTTTTNAEPEAPVPVADLGHAAAGPLSARPTGYCKSPTACRRCAPCGPNIRGPSATST